MWSDLLAVPLLGIHDNFFVAGGHSLLATRLIAQIRNVVRVELPVKAVFDAPTVAALTQRVEQALRQDEEIPLPPLVAVERPQEIPLSFAQQRLWFLEQLEPGSSAYLIPTALHVQGVVDVSYLEQALKALIGRHESLRTTFEERAGQPVQVIHPGYSSSLPVIDLQTLKQEQREQETRRLVNQEAQHPSDLAQGPLLRTSLLRLEKQEQILLLTLHHIITDGWSSEIFVHDLTTLYCSLVTGQPSPLAPLAVQYADYALWQRGWLQGGVLEAQLAYWREKLAGVPPLEMSIDHPRRAIQTSHGAVQTLHLPIVISEEIVALSRREHVTLFMTLLAAWQVLLQRYSGQDDFSVGTPIANRRQAEIESVIGFFVNTLVLRADLSGNPTFTQVLQRVREVCLGAYAHQDVPFEQIVEALAPARDLSRSPLFQVMFVLQNLPHEQEQEDLAGVRIETLTMESTVSKFDLTLSLGETENGLAGTLEYNTNLFETSTITRLLSHWQTLLEGIVQNPYTPIAQLPLLTEEEQKYLLLSWNAQSPDAPSELCVHQIFEQQVQQTPDAVALVFEDEVLTYAELNRRANHLAHALHQRGVGPEMLVGLCVERSLYLLIGLLGILKAGGAYVPFDLTSPPERLAFFLEDAQIQVLVTQQSALENLTFWQGQMLCLDRDWSVLAQQEETNLNVNSSSEQLAYIIYTSGSTGQPKGVQVSHANVTRLLRATASTLPFSAKDTWTLFHSYTFDFSVWEIWGALLFGGQLVVVSYWVARSPDLFWTLLNERAVTVLNQTPSAFQQLQQVDATQPGGEDLALRLIIFGGEALDLRQLTPWWERHGDQSPQLVNMYGITETTVHVTSYLLTQIDLEEDQGSRIGWPLSDLYCTVLTRDQQLVPIGIPGELFVGGLGLSRGYLHRADVTAERFVPNPWSQEPGARLYRTGDLVRFHEDASMQYLGRVDQQVKIRGYRIELGEIEAALREHPVVQDAVVLAREDVPGDKRLVAYVVQQPGQILTMSTMRSFLQDRLPVYMLPAAFVLLESLPLTANGKLDRKGLPVPEEWVEEDGAGQQHTGTPIEEVVLGLWSAGLGRSQIGIHDNFFEVGGHSLLATQLLARVRAILNVEIPLRVLFEEPTVSKFAQRVEQVLRESAGAPVLSVVAGVRPEAIPLSFAQPRLWLLEQLEPESHVYLVPTALHLQGTLDARCLEQALEELIDRHESLRTTFEERMGHPMQVIHPGYAYMQPVIDLQMLVFEQRVEEARWLVSQEAQHPCNLAQGPLLRTSLLRLERNHMFWC